IAVDRSCQRQTTTTQMSIRTPTVSTTVPATRARRRSTGLIASAPRAEIARDHGNRLAGVDPGRRVAVHGGAADVPPAGIEDVGAMLRRREPELHNARARELRGGQ